MYFVLLFYVLVTGGMAAHDFIESRRKARVLK